MTEIDFATRRICGMSYSDTIQKPIVKIISGRPVIEFESIKPGETIESFNSRKLYNENDCKYCNCKNTIKNNECVRCGAPYKL